VTGTAHNAQRTTRTKNLTVRTTADFTDDLAVLTGTVQPDGKKLDRTAAVHRAVQLLADAYRRAWDYGDVPRGTAPEAIAVRYRTADGTPEPVPVVRAKAVHEIPFTYGGRSGAV
jgi:hypothetical protein